jgi:hypothetical protein
MIIQLSSRALRSRRRKNSLVHPHEAQHKVQRLPDGLEENQENTGLPKFSSYEEAKEELVKVATHHKKRILKKKYVSINKGQLNNNPDLPVENRLEIPPELGRSEPIGNV